MPLCRDRGRLMPQDRLIRWHTVAGGRFADAAVKLAIGLFAVALIFAGASAQGHAADAGVRTFATGLQFPEGPVFVGNSLYFVDYGTSDVLRIVDGKPELVWHRPGCGANGLATVGGQLFVACYDSGSIVEITTGGKTLETISRDDKGGQFVNPNDFAPIADGSLYFTASGDSAVPGKIYYRTSRGEVRQVAGGLGYANGLAVSPDSGTLYLAESDEHRLLAYRIGAGGALTDKRVLVDLDSILGGDGRKITPDGLPVDKAGRLFVGLYDGGGFAVLTGTGELIRKIELPGRYHANLALTPDGKDVFVTATGGGIKGCLLEVGNPLAN